MSANWVSVTECARLAGVTRDRVYWWIRTGMVEARVYEKPRRGYAVRRNSVPGFSEEGSGDG